MMISLYHAQFYGFDCAICNRHVRMVPIRYSDDGPFFCSYICANKEDDEEDIDIGICWCGQYGRLGSIHNRMIDGQMEECGEYL